MLFAPPPNGEGTDEPESFSSPHLTQENECVCHAERVSQALRQTGHSGLHDIGVSVRDSVVFLRGRVASYHLKQLAQEAVRKIFGDSIIRNELEVIS